MGPVDSDRVSRARSYSGAKPCPFPCRVRDFHPLWPPIPERSARVQEQLCLVLQPHPDESGWFRLIRVRSPLLTESRFLSLPPGTEMFHFPGLSSISYKPACAGPLLKDSAVFTAEGFPIRTSTDQRQLAPPRGLSQLATSFFDFWRQGIHHTLLLP